MLFHLGFGWRRIDFGAHDCGLSPSIATRYNPARTALPTAVRVVRRIRMSELVAVLAVGLQRGRVPVITYGVVKILGSSAPIQVRHMIIRTDVVAVAHFRAGYSFP